MRAGHGVEMDGTMGRKISLGVRYPPLPRWMEKLPGNKRDGSRGAEGGPVKWMEMLPGNRRKLGRQRSGSGYGSVRSRIVVG